MATEPTVPRTAAAIAAHMRRAAERAAADPPSLARALRVVAVADVDDVRAVIDQAPALTAAQVERLRGLLPPAGEPQDAA
jgi:hypothetical protein